MEASIKNCKRLFHFRCPRKWDKLVITQIETVRYCDTYKKNVYFCESEEDLAHHAGQCVAVYDGITIIEGMERLGEDSAVSG